MTNQNSNKKQSAVKWLFPIGVIIVLILVIYAGQRPKDRILYIKQIGGPHKKITDFAPTTCNECHKEVYADWESSPHAGSVKSVPFASGIKMAYENSGAEAASKCLTCHAPRDTEFKSLENYQNINASDIASSGVDCASCHTSEAVWRRMEFDLEVENTGFLPPPSPPMSAEYCAGCHDHKVSMKSLMDSRFDIKPSGNVYREWLESKYSAEGENFKSCLDCHGHTGSGTMHRWEITPEILWKGITVEEIPFKDNGDGMTGGIKITNTGVGHDFPSGDPGKMVGLIFYERDEFEKLGKSEQYEILRKNSRYRFVNKYQNKFVEGETEEDIDNRLKAGETVEILVKVGTEQVTGEGVDEIYGMREIPWILVYGNDPGYPELFGDAGESVLFGDGVLKIPDGYWLVEW